MNEKTWWRTFQHPYQEITKAQPTHGKLIKTSVKVPPYSTFAVPFRWMLRQNQEAIDARLGMAARERERVLARPTAPVHEAA